MTLDVFRRIAAAHREGRRLYVTTVELESGGAYIWPLSKIAFDAVHPSSSSTADSAAHTSEADEIDPARR